VDTRRGSDPGDLKTSRAGRRTPFQILANYYQTGDTRGRGLWVEYSRTIRNVAAVRWSRGLCAVFLGPANEPERTDEELAAEEVSGEVLAVIPFPVWSRIRTEGLERSLLVTAEYGAAWPP
jgi:hypothetical protein